MYVSGVCLYGDIGLLFIQLPLNYLAVYRGHICGYMVLSMFSTYIKQIRTYSEGVFAPQNGQIKRKCDIVLTGYLPIFKVPFSY